MGKVQYDSMGQPQRIRGVTGDITERCQAELELREANRKKDEFLAMLAHELRNPLAPISTAAEMLRLTANCDARTLRASEVISRQVKHMTSLVDDLLDVSRVTSGLVQLDKEYVDIKSVVASAVEQSRPLIESRRHNLTVKMDAGLSVFEGDRNRMVQVIANLLNNAAKYTAQCGEIELAVDATDTTINISVTDNGIGIEAKLLPSLFDLFTQAERTPDRAEGGLGIGLALVKTLVTLHHGTVTATSAGPGKGSTFTIALPASNADFHGPVAGAIGEAPNCVSIMIVDDNVDAAQSLADLLTAQGHKVNVQSHPLAAISAARADPPQLFILDIGLPEIDGYELVRRLHEEPTVRGALFIALTGYGQTHDRILSKSAGFDHHFVKPMDSQKLSALIALTFGG